MSINLTASNPGRITRDITKWSWGESKNSDSLGKTAVQNPVTPSCYANAREVRLPFKALGMAHSDNQAGH
jgi:hypothetical protein